MRHYVESSHIYERLYSLLWLTATISIAILCMGRQAYPQAVADFSSQTAQGTAAESDEALLKSIQNPVADLISVPILNTTNFNMGSYSRAQNVLALQPVIPMNLTDNWMLISRIIQPMVWQGYPDQSGGGKFGLGDMTPSFFLAPRNPGGLIWGAGPALVIPTATSNILGQGKFSVGPSVVVLAQPGPWTLGALVSNVWSVAGAGTRPPVNRMTLQYFLAYNLPHDWYLTAAPILVADWRAQASNQWLVPVGGGVGKLVTFGSKPVDFSATFYSNVVVPNGMPTWQMNLQMTLLFPQGH